MKPVTKVLMSLLLAALPFSLLAQNPTVIVAYMKVAPGQFSNYLEVEQSWKKLHQKAVEVGVHNGWQLWRNVHAGMNDPYHYITIQWYDNYEHSFGEDAPDGWTDGVYTDTEMETLMEKTTAARTYAFEEVSHQVVAVDSSREMKYLLVSRNHVPVDRVSDYIKMETEIFKPYQEEAIRKEILAHWGIWRTWPYKEGQPRFIIVEGYKDAKQLTTSGEDVLSIVHPELNWEDLIVEIRKNRTEVSTELWELVDQVFPQE